MVDLSKLTNQAQAILSRTLELAIQSNQSKATDLHLLQALLDQDGVGRSLMAQLAEPKGVEQIEILVREKLASLAVAAEKVAQPRPSSSLIQILEKSFELAKHDGHEFVAAEFLLLALVLTDCQSRVIVESFVDKDKLEKE
ncbi:hypothetical protein MUP65_02250, partial [Patescibacteria group bacterium]|nr:hypothetical protein [Patescibacteria group bacterium]